MSGPHDRLDAAMEARRTELRLSWRKVVRRAEISYEGLRAIRRGERTPTPVTQRGIEAALEWEPGSVDEVLRGGEPTPSTRSAVDEPDSSDVRPTLRDDFERDIWTDTSLSVDKRLDLIAHYRASKIADKRDKSA